MEIGKMVKFSFENRLQGLVINSVSLSLWVSIQGSLTNSIRGLINSRLWR